MISIFVNTHERGEAAEKNNIIIIKKKERMGNN